MNFLLILLIVYPVQGYHETQEEFASEVYPIAIPNIDDLFTILSEALFVIFLATAVAIKKSIDEIQNDAGSAISAIEQGMKDVLSESEILTYESLQYMSDGINEAINDFQKLIDYLDTSYDEVISKGENVSDDACKAALQTWNKAQNNINKLIKYINKYHRFLSKKLDALKEKYGEESAEFKEAAKELFMKSEMKLHKAFQLIGNSLKGALSLPKNLYYELDLDNVYHEWIKFVNLVEGTPQELLVKMQRMFNTMYFAVNVKFFIILSSIPEDLWSYAVILWIDVINCKKFFDNSFVKLTSYTRHSMNYIKKHYANDVELLEKEIQALLWQVEEEIQILLDLTEIPIKRLASFNAKIKLYFDINTGNKRYNANLEHLTLFLKENGYPVYSDDQQFVPHWIENENNQPKNVYQKMDSQSPHEENNNDDNAQPYRGMTFFDYGISHGYNPEILTDQKNKNKEDITFSKNVYSRISHERTIADIQNVNKIMFKNLQKNIPRKDAYGKLVLYKFYKDSLVFKDAMNLLMKYVNQSGLLIETNAGILDEKYADTLQRFSIDIKYRIDVMATFLYMTYIRSIDYKYNNPTTQINFTQANEKISEKRNIDQDKYKSEMIIPSQHNASLIPTLSEVESVTDREIKLNEDQKSLTKLSQIPTITSDVNTQNIVNSNKLQQLKILENGVSNDVKTLQNTQSPDIPSQIPLFSANIQKPEFLNSEINFKNESPVIDNTGNQLYLQTVENDQQKNLEMVQNISNPLLANTVRIDSLNSEFNYEAKSMDVINNENQSQLEMGENSMQSEIEKLKNMPVSNFSSVSNFLHPTDTSTSKSVNSELDIEMESTFIGNDRIHPQLETKEKTIQSNMQTSNISSVPNFSLLTNTPSSDFISSKFNYETESTVLDVENQPQRLQAMEQIMESETKMTQPSVPISPLFTNTPISKIMNSELNVETASTIVNNSGNQPELLTTGQNVQNEIEVLKSKDVSNIQPVSNFKFLSNRPTYEGDLGTESPITNNVENHTQIMAVNMQTEIERLKNIEESNMPFVQNLSLSNDKTTSELVLGNQSQPETEQINMKKEIENLQNMQTLDYPFSSNISTNKSNFGRSDTENIPQPAIVNMHDEIKNMQASNELFLINFPFPTKDASDSGLLGSELDSRKQPQPGMEHINMKKEIENLQTQTSLPEFPFPTNTPSSGLVNSDFHYKVESEVIKHDENQPQLQTMEQTMGNEFEKLQNKQTSTIPFTKDSPTSEYINSKLDFGKESTTIGNVGNQPEIEIMGQNLQTESEKLQNMQTSGILNFPLSTKDASDSGLLGSELDSRKQLQQGMEHINMKKEIENLQTQTSFPEFPFPTNAPSSGLVNSDFHYKVESEVIKHDENQPQLQTMEQTMGNEFEKLQNKQTSTIPFTKDSPTSEYINSKLDFGKESVTISNVGNQPEIGIMGQNLQTESEKLQNMQTSGILNFPLSTKDTTNSEFLNSQLPLGNQSQPKMEQINMKKEIENLQTQTSLPEFPFPTNTPSSGLVNSDFHYKVESEVIKHDENQPQLQTMEQTMGNEFEKLQNKQTSTIPFTKDSPTSEYINSKLELGTESTTVSNFGNQPKIGVMEQNLQTESEKLQNMQTSGILNFPLSTKDTTNSEFLNSQLPLGNQSQPKMEQINMKKEIENLQTQTSLPEFPFPTNTPSSGLVNSDFHYKVESEVIKHDENQPQLQTMEQTMGNEFEKLQNKQTSTIPFTKDSPTSEYINSKLDFGKESVTISNVGNQPEIGIMGQNLQTESEKLQNMQTSGILNFPLSTKDTTNSEFLNSQLPLGNQSQPKMEQINMKKEIENLQTQTSLPEFPFPTNTPSPVIKHDENQPQLQTMEQTMGNEFEKLQNKQTSTIPFTKDSPTSEYINSKLELGTESTTVSNFGNQPKIGVMEQNLQTESEKLQNMQTSGILNFPLSTKDTTNSEFLNSQLPLGNQSQPKMEQINMKKEIENLQTQTSLPEFPFPTNTPSSGLVNSDFHYKVESEVIKHDENQPQLQTMEQTMGNEFEKLQNKQTSTIPFTKDSPTSEYINSKLDFGKESVTISNVGNQPEIGIMGQNLQTESEKLQNMQTSGILNFPLSTKDTTNSEFLNSQLPLGNQSQPKMEQINMKKEIENLQTQTSLPEFPFPTNTPSSGLVNSDFHYKVESEVIKHDENQPQLQTMEQTMGNEFEKLQNKQTSTIPFTKDSPTSEYINSKLELGTESTTVSNFGNQPKIGVMEQNLQTESEKLQNMRTSGILNFPLSTKDASDSGLLNSQLPLGNHPQPEIINKNYHNNVELLQNFQTNSNTPFLSSTVPHMTKPTTHSSENLEQLISMKSNIETLEKSQTNSNALFETSILSHDINTSDVSLNDSDFSKEDKHLVYSNTDVKKESHVSTNDRNGDGTVDEISSVSSTKVVTEELHVLSSDK
ncbi:hypothetical protein PGB90_009589 [Kerria lacca]